MKQPKISIIIPVYNVEPYIAECLQSVMRQTYQGPMECIVVDDCVTDKSMEIVEQLVADYDGSITFRVLYHEHHQGVSAARNTGIEVAKGDYIYFIDSDDYVSDNCLELLTRPLQDADYDMVVGDLVTFGKPCDIPFISNETRAVFGREKLFDELCSVGTTYTMAWNKIIKASLFRQFDLSFLEGQIHEDELWTYKTALCLESMYVLRVPTYYYRVRESSITSNAVVNVEKVMKSRYATINYVLDHPANVLKESYDKYILRRFELYVRPAFRTKVDFRDDFVSLRRKFDYHLLPQVLKGNMGMGEAKKQLYLLLPPDLGCFILRLRRWKKHMINAINIG